MAVSRRQDDDLHVEGKLQLGVSVRVVDLEESVDEFLEVDVSTGVQVEHGEEALADDAGQLRVLQTKKTRPEQVSFICKGQDEFADDLGHISSINHRETSCLKERIKGWFECLG